MDNIFQLLLLSALICSFTLIFVVSLYFTLKLLFLSNRLKQKYVVFEVKPLRETLQSEFSTQQFFTLIHGLLKPSTFLDRIMENFKSYSFEIVSTKNEGIRYLIRVNKEDSELLKRSLLSYLPGITIKKVADYIPGELSRKPNRVVNFKLSNHFAYPLKKQKALKEHDPIAYITGSMTKLSGKDLISFQAVLAPVGKSAIGNASKIAQDIYIKRDLVNSLKNYKSDTFLLSLVKQTLFIVIRILTVPIGILIFFATGGKEGPIPNIKLNKKYCNSSQLLFLR